MNSKTTKQKRIALLEAELWNLKNKIGTRVFSKEHGYGVTSTMACVLKNSAFVDVKIGKRASSVIFNCRLSDLFIVRNTEFGTWGVDTVPPDDLKEIIRYFTTPVLQELIDCCVETMEYLSPRELIGTTYSLDDFMPDADCCLIQEWSWAKTSLEQIQKINQRNS